MGSDFFALFCNQELSLQALDQKHLLLNLYVEYLQQLTYCYGTAKKFYLSFEFEKALSSEETAIKQVRALELIIRDVITEQLGGKENVILKLQELFKQDVIDKWIKSADQSGVLSGTTFSELSNILLDKKVQLEGSDRKVPIDMSLLPSGNYLLKIRSAQNEETIKFIKQ